MEAVATPGLKWSAVSLEGGHQTFKPKLFSMVRQTTYRVHVSISIPQFKKKHIASDRSCIVCTYEQLVCMCTRSRVAVILACAPAQLQSKAWYVRTARSPSIFMKMLKQLTLHYVLGCKGTRGSDANAPRKYLLEIFHKIRKYVTVPSFRLACASR